MTLRKATIGLLALSVALNLVGIGFLATVGHPPALLTPLTTLVTFAFAVLHAGGSLGWRRGIGPLVIVAVTGLAFESIGVATGAVYGPYHYTAKLGPKFLDLVPFLIPVAWFMMIYLSFRIANDLADRWGLRGFWQDLAAAGLGAVAMTACDLAMDPMMVAAGHWVWEKPGPYFGIPLQNFWGWWLTTFTALGLYGLLQRWLGGRNRPLMTSAMPVIAYAAMGASTIAADFLIGLGGPGMVGIFAMLPWIGVGLSPNPQTRSTISSEKI
ncbi:predicted membrane protein [Longilinea arvoryzae]|uniref:Predicted membrane protein n=1 Tax=Longilinea arvoryzae TaxID=360412 RepID=A0A0S7BL64_9CHLR|nr:carotenoid biosynthesis protein [Longilinea arvoryzae]GAP15254.1 predicted membrane protein [Longilinea arvoryzae]